MKISELIAAVGDENVTIQNLDTCADSLDWSKGITRIKFGVGMPIDLVNNRTERMGIVVWLPREAVNQAMAVVDAAKGKGR